MTTETSLITRDDSKGLVSFTVEAVKIREAALNSCALIDKVDSPETNEAAVAAQSELQSVISVAEKARKAAKEPIIRFGKLVDKTHEDFIEPALQEMRRVSTKIGNYQALLESQRRAAENARNAELTRLERERQEALAKAKTLDAQDAVDKHFNDKAAEVPTPIVEPVRAEGQRVTKDWEITKINEWTLAKARPDLVRRIEFDTRGIKDALKRGEKLPGVEAREVINASVRPVAQRAIEV